jgi:CsoR family transcriptional regulator, copper-sensing transcriptional repressor
MSKHKTSERKAVAVDADGRRRNLARLKRIEGQVRGIQKMVEEERYCADVLLQISAVQEALRGVGKELLRNHLEHCLAHAGKQGGQTAAAAYDEVVDLVFRKLR